jgi:catechol 2,3-dioxygenase-like lactoylglutathione lyase family enzyme
MLNGGVILIKGLYEVHFQVENLERSIAFYEKLGFSLAWKNEHVAFLWIDQKKAGWDFGKNLTGIMFMRNMSRFAWILGRWQGR